jgi:hypothetical protein
MLGCSSADQNRNIELHPDPRKVPYINTEKFIVPKDIVSAKSDHILIRNFNQIVNEFSVNKDKMTELDFSIGNYDHLGIISLSPNRFLILDKRRNTVDEFNVLLSRSGSPIATYGRGPGDLAFATDLVASNKEILIAMQDQRISSFDCSIVPCSYSNTIILEDFSPFSVDRFMNGFIAVGMQSVRGESDVNRFLESPEPIRVFDEANGSFFEFGNSYNTDGNWMLARPLTEGIIRADIDEGWIALAFRRFPYLIIYNDQLELSNIYQFDDFITGLQEYHVQERMLNIVMSDHSLINNIFLLSNGHVFIEIEHKKNMRQENYSFIWDRQSDYYLIDIINRKTSFLGNVLFDDSSIQKILFAEHGALFINSDSVHWRSFSIPSDVVQ